MTGSASVLWASQNSGETSDVINRIFDPNNFVFRSLSRGLNVVLLGMLWLVCSLPVVTLGASTAALYYSVVKCIRKGEDAPFGNFFRCFRRNFRASLPLSVLTAVLWYFLTWGYRIMLTLANTQGGMMVAVFVAYGVMLLVPLGTLCYLFPLLSRFELGPGALLAVGFRLALRHLPTTIALVLLLLETVNLCGRYWYLYFLPIFLAPGIVTLLFSLFLERIFKTIMPKETSFGMENEEQPWYLR